MARAAKNTTPTRHDHALRRIPFKFAIVCGISSDRISASPIKSDRTPAPAIRCTSAFDWIPDSATRICLSSTNSASRSVVVRSVVNVRKSRLLIPRSEYDRIGNPITDRTRSSESSSCTSISGSRQGRIRAASRRSDCST